MMVCQRSFWACAVMAITFAVVGCGLLEIKRTEFPEQAVGEADALLFIEDLQDITQDTTLSSDEQEEVLGELGLGSADLIEAIVDDGLR